MIDERLLQRPRHFEAVREAWMMSVPTPFHAEQTWSDTGADSLATLTLLLRLEKSVGRKLAFDFVHPNITPTVLAHQLDILDQERTHAIAKAPLAFLVPGILGDEPILANFRRSLPAVTFETLDLPMATAPTGVLADIPETGRWIARDIQRRHPAGEIVLAGFSFGGAVAFEAARSLIDSGRSVALLVVLDTLLWPSTLVAAPATPAPRRPGDVARLLAALRDGRLLRAARNLRWRYRRDIALRLMEFGTARRLILRTAESLRPDLLLDLRARALMRLRGEALDRWRPAPLPVAAVLAASNHSTPAIRARWRELLERLEIVPLDVAHLEIFSPRALETLAPAVDAAMVASVSTAPSAIGGGDADDSGGRSDVAPRDHARRNRPGQRSSGAKDDRTDHGDW